MVFLQMEIPSGKKEFMIFYYCCKVEALGTTAAEGQSKCSGMEVLLILFLKISRLEALDWTAGTSFLSGTSSTKPNEEVLN